MNISTCIERIQTLVYRSIDQCLHDAKWHEQVQLRAFLFYRQIIENFHQSSNLNRANGCEIENCLR